MKVLVVAEFGLSGGTRSFFKRLLEIHSTHQLQTIVVTDQAVDAEMDAYIRKRGAGYRIIKKRPKYHLFSVFNTYRYLHPIIRDFQPDLVVGSAGSLRLYFYPFFRDLPTLYFLHTYPSGHRRSSGLRYWAPRYLTGRRHRICTVSDSAAESITAAWKVDRKNIDVLYNSFNQKNVHLHTEPPAGGEENTTVLTLGHVVDYKNPSVWLKVAVKITGMFPDVEFKWMGEGPLLNEFRKKTRNHPRIRFMGHERDVAACYRDADIYFQPSRKESHGISVVDAMANALPCVVSNVGGLAESVEHGRNGFLCPVNDVEGYAEKIMDLLKRPERRKRMGVHGYQRAQELFHPDLQEKKWMELYTRVTT